MDLAEILYTGSMYLDIMAVNFEENLHCCKAIIHGFVTLG